MSARECLFASIFPAKKSHRHKHYFLRRGILTGGDRAAASVVASEIQEGERDLNIVNYYFGNAGGHLRQLNQRRNLERVVGEAGNERGTGGKEVS